MTGRVEWDEPGNDIVDPYRVVMVLEDDGVFRSERLPGYAGLLTEELRDAYSPAHGEYGVKFLRELAARHGGEATIEPFDRSVPGIDY